MQTVEAFFDGEEDIAAFWAIDTDQHAVLIAQADADDAAASCWIAIVVEIVDDLFFQCVFICWIHDAVFVAALEVDVDVVGADLNGAGLFPVNFCGVVAVFVLLHDGVAELFHDRNVEAAVFTDQRWNVFANDEAVVRNDENGPVFVEIVQEFAR